MRFALYDVVVPEPPGAGREAPGADDAAPPDERSALALPPEAGPAGGGVVAAAGPEGAVGRAQRRGRG